MRRPITGTFVATDGRGRRLFPLVIPGRRVSGEPGIRTRRLWLEIPGSRFRLRSSSYGGQVARPGNDGGESYTTTLSRFAARVIPVYSHLARLSWNAKLSSNSTTSSHCEPWDLCTVST